MSTFDEREKSFEKKPIDPFGEFENLGEYEKDQLLFSFGLSNGINRVFTNISRKDFGVLGGKIIGAGGGGFLMLYNPSKDSSLQEYMESRGLIRLNYGVDFMGTTMVGI